MVGRSRVCLPVRLQMKVGMQRLLTAVPRGQRYSCRQCSWCCRWWRIEVTPADRDRIFALDWAAESPRLRGVALFEEQRLPGRADPVIQTAQVGGQCVFLEEDGLCLIHKLLGPEAKPIVCQGFPLVLGRTVDGVLVGGNYACAGLAGNEGMPFARQEAFVLELLERPEAEDRAAIGLDSVIDPEPLLSGGTRMSWRAYLELERSLLEVLARREFTVTQRLLAAGALVSALAVRSARKALLGEEEVGAWLEERRQDGYTRAFARALDAGSTHPLWQRAALAPVVAEVEAAPLSATDPGSRPTRYALAIVRGAGEIPLSTLRGRVNLAAMKRVVFDQDSPRFDDYLTRFLSNFLIRKSLLESASLKEGCDHLCLYLALIRWYALASAAMGSRGEVEEQDLIAGIQVVEKGYVHRAGPQSGLRRGLLSALSRVVMPHLVRPATLAQDLSPKRGGEKLHLPS